MLLFVVLVVLVLLMLVVLNYGGLIVLNNRLGKWLGDRLDQRIELAGQIIHLALLLVVRWRRSDMSRDRRRSRLVEDINQRVKLVCQTVNGSILCSLVLARVSVRSLNWARRRRSDMSCDRRRSRLVEDINQRVKLVCQTVNGSILCSLVLGRVSVRSLNWARRNSEDFVLELARQGG